MPTLRQARNTNMKGWQKAPPVAAPNPTGNPAQPPAHTSTTGTAQRSPYMLNSMPPMASNADAFQRQFYSGANVPTYRILLPPSGASK
jgi:hypothetical protein